MAYRVRQMVLGPPKFVDVTEQEYKDGVKARDKLLAALQIEQKYRLLLMNYKEWEDELLTSANRRVVFNIGDSNAMLDELYEVSRRLINLLTTARLYRDQTKHDISQFFGKESEQFNTVDGAFSKEYDSRLGFRTMEVLRDFAQHRSLPLEQIVQDASRTNSNSGDLWEHACIPNLSVKEIERDGGWRKKPNLEELKANADSDGRLDLKPLVRDYLEGLAAVHALVRGLLESDIKSAELRFNSLRERFTKVHGGDLLGVALVDEDIEARTIPPEKTHYLTPEIITRRQHLSVDSTDFRRRFVSNQAKSDMTRWKFPPKTD